MAVVCPKISPAARRTRSAFGLAGTLALAWACTGCGHASASDKALAQMRDAVTRMQADRDRVDQRLEALEIALADEKEQRLRDAERRGDHGRSTPVRSTAIQARVPDDAEAETTDDLSIRPEIRVVGTGSKARGTRGAPSSTYVQDSQGFDSDDGTARPSALDPEAKRAYEAALELVRAKQYDRGLEALTSFLVRWPGHPYAENAMYWRGEAYYAKNDFGRAAQEFEAVVARFSTGAKVPDAMLKLGMCHERLGDAARAREDFQRLRNEYPRSSAATKIPSGTTESASKGSKENR